ncbi:MAG: rhodanese-like domain-containing protein [Paludibacteraceae bacterium]|nr:rhodanese-like domain-containing protein [Paludibacteraceae bacterium]
MKRILFLQLCLAAYLTQASAQSQPVLLNADAFATYIASDSVQVVDIRTAAEFASGHIDGAVNIDFYAPDFVEQFTDRVDKSHPVAVYCRSGKRSASAALRLTQAGYRVTDLRGGVLEWQQRHPLTH